MLTHGSILVSLLWLVEQIPTPPPLAKRQRGRQETYSDTLFVKALIVMIIRRLYTVYALLSFLEQAAPVAQQLRPLLTEHGRFPTRRTWERRFEKGCGSFGTMAQRRAMTSFRSAIAGHLW